MNSVFVGQLSKFATRHMLEKLFAVEDIGVVRINYTPGSDWAVVDCEDQNAADHAIEMLNGVELLDQHLVVEPSLYKKDWIAENRESPPKEFKVQIRQISADANWDELEDLAKSSGGGGDDLVTFERAGSDVYPHAIVTFATMESASKCAFELNGKELGGSAIRAFVVGDHRGTKPSRRTPNRMASGEPMVRADFPLKMSVDARYVGAIIGQGGANIRAIAKECKARCVVDVNRGFRDQSGNPEKVINIFGMPENCSKAAMKILEVVQKELAKEVEHPVEPELKIRVHNNLVGRLIGKAGGTIRKIMEETGCNVFVSNIGEMTTYSPERTITIRGPNLEAISAAEERISTKLRAAWENDMSVGVMPPTGPPPFMQFPLSEPFMLHGGAPMLPSSHSRFGPTGITEVTQAWIPNSIVGALIGTKGVHIRQVMRMTGAQVRVEPASDGTLGPDTDRLVTITGNDIQQWQAQLWLFQRVAEQTSRFIDEVRLCVEINVPIKLVGRLIGKNGANIRDLQRMTGAQVKIPNETGGEQAAVQIAGTFEAVQAVQARMRQLIAQFNQHQLQHQQIFVPSNNNVDGNTVDKVVESTAAEA